MENSQNIKKAVREKYGQIAKTEQKKSDVSCCESKNDLEAFCCFSEGYDQLEGYAPDADYGLGCGLPTKHTIINEGDTVLDLGAGAGNDCFVARRITGKKGYVIGVDMTPEMVFKARENAEKLNYDNVDFRLGEIEALPVDANSVDVVVSNCVINLVPDKSKAFKETYRVLKPGGHFSISDIVINGDIPEALRNDLSAYAGCISGAIHANDYLQQIKDAGFENVSIRETKKHAIPNSIMEKYPELNQYPDKQKPFSLESITVHAEKQHVNSTEAEPCCEPENNERKTCC